MSTLQKEILQEADGITTETRVCGITQQRIGGLFTKIGTELGVLDTTKETPAGAQDKATHARTDAISEARRGDNTLRDFTTTQLDLKADRTTVLEVICSGTKWNKDSSVFNKTQGCTITHDGGFTVSHEFGSMNYVVFASSFNTDTVEVKVRSKSSRSFVLYVNDPINMASCNGCIDFVAFKL